MDKYECTVCDYVYDPEIGDPSYSGEGGYHPEGGIDEGTSFEDLPDDWVCPKCHANKDMFKKQ